MNERQLPNILKNNAIPYSNVIIKEKKLHTNEFAKKQIKRFFEQNKICSDEEFLKAVESGDYKRLEALNYLDKHLEIKDKSGRPLLHLAASQGQCP